jgi:hypothetical protein
MLFYQADVYTAKTQYQKFETNIPRKGILVAVYTAYTHYTRTPLYFFNSEAMFKYACVSLTDFSVGNDFDVRI